MALLKYNDLFLEDFDSTWCDDYRTLYHRFFIMAAHKLVDYYKLEQQHPHRILNVLEGIIKYEPYDDEIRTMILNLYLKCYGKVRALEYYQEYVGLLKEDLDSQPSVKFDNFYKLYLKEE